MKTVMKKMFCLMLVAVLLVSAAPAAFATETCPEGAHTWGEGVVEVEATCENNGRTTFTCTTCGATTSQYPDPLGHTAVTDAAVPATCAAEGKSEGSHCSVCNAVLVAQTTIPALAHTEAVLPAVTTSCAAAGKSEGKKCSVCNTILVEQETIPALAHTYGSNQVCTVCGYCAYCTQTISGSTKHSNTCPNSENYMSTCEKCGKEYVTSAGHNDCEYCAVCWANGDKVKTHKTANHCAECGNTKGGHDSDCSKYSAPQTGKYTLRVFANLYTGDVKTKTIELTPYTKLSEDTLIYDFIANHASQIRAQMPSGYSWSGNVYDHDNDDHAVGTNTRLGAGTSVYLNFRSEADYVYIYVHTGRTYEIDRTYKMDGKKVGETIYKSEVKNIVKKNYNVNSMSMFTNTKDWEKYVQGKSIDAVDTVTAKSGITEIHVRISGSSKSSSSTKADSSNPKTGDMIFTPVIVMGASVSCLAALYYVNKKRAF